MRCAVHGVVAVLAACMNPSDRDESGEMHTAAVVGQNLDGSCDVRLLGDLATAVRGVYVKLSNATLDADARTRVSAYASDVHCQADNLHTESGAHVSRHATSTAMAMVNEGAAGGSARSHDDAPKGPDLLFLKLRLNMAASGGPTGRNATGDWSRCRPVEG